MTLACLIKASSLHFPDDFVANTGFVKEAFFHYFQGRFQEKNQYGKDQ